MALSRRVWLTAAVATPVAVVAGRRLVQGGADQPPASVSITQEGEQRLVASNGLPAHITGDFPNPHDPVPLRAQQLRYEMPLRGTVAEQATPLGMWHFGV